MNPSISFYTLLNNSNRFLHYYATDILKNDQVIRKTLIKKMVTEREFTFTVTIYHDITKV